jgi:hypothetical protein
VPAPAEQTAGAGLHTHAAEPGAPWQVSFIVQVVVAPPKVHAPSCAQFTTVLPLQTGPVAPLQIDGLQEHRPVLALHVAFAPHEVVVWAKKQPASWAQCTDELPTHTSPAAEQFGSVTQLQTAAPAVGVVHWWWSPQATAVSA